MELTEENKTFIDSLPLGDLLYRWRFAPIGDPWMQGPTGKYWGERMAYLRNQPGGNKAHVAASKSIGWEK
jgi:hypothetical protein